VYFWHYRASGKLSWKLATIRRCFIAALVINVSEYACVYVGGISVGSEVSLGFNSLS
jgi:hypothetical protein